MKYKKENQNQNMFQINVVVACCVSPYQYRFAVHEKLFDPTMNMLERDVCIWQRRTTADDPKTQQQQQQKQEIKPQCVFLVAAQKKVINLFCTYNKQSFDMY